MATFLVWVSTALAIAFAVVSGPPPDSVLSCWRKLNRFSEN